MSHAYQSSADFFEAKYRHKADPWSFADNTYELNRYDAIMTALDHRRYQRVFEPGCSVGVLTQRLAGLCGRVDAIDFSQTAVMHARQRCAHLPNVEIGCGSLYERVSIQEFDLTVLSEIGYYCTRAEWAAITTRLVASMPAGATLLGAHWLGESADHHLSGDEVHGVLASNPLLLLERAERHEAFRLDRWVRI